MLQRLLPRNYIKFNHLTHLHSERGVHINHSLFPIILPFWNFNLKNMKPRIYYITHRRRNKNQTTTFTIHFIMTIIFYEYCSSTFWANSYLFNIIILFCAHVYIICTRIIILPKRKESIFIFFYFSLFFSVFVCTPCIIHHRRGCVLHCVLLVCVFFL